MANPPRGRHQTQAVLVALGIVLGVGGLWSRTMSWAEEERSSRSSPRRRAASGTNEEAKTERKLSEILANQQKILDNQELMLQRFDAVMDELRIVKVRATN